MQVADKDYMQESVVPTEAGGETHGGTNVFIGAQGLGAENIRGVLDNTEVFGLVKKAVGL
jgi:alkaline phosphatase